LNSEPEEGGLYLHREVYPAALGGARYQLHQPIPSSSGDSSGVPQRRQMMEEQSPQVSGSFTSLAQFGQ